ncbi:MAG: chorismate-binding protein [Gammaproteobacteria bacterium AqS3]|nr:chorismate-binding protein [Gammaproteobacteria bacterium AqS3]
MSKNQEEFRRLASEGYNRIPLVRKKSADLDTPVSVWAKLADAPGGHLLESMHGGEHWGRYSSIGLPVRTMLRGRERYVEIITDGEVVVRCSDVDPIQFVAEYMQQIRAAPLPSFPRLGGGLVGYFGYECARHIEPHLNKSLPPDHYGIPDLLFGVSERMVIFDNLTGEMNLVVYANPERPDAYERAEAELDRISEALKQPLPDALRTQDVDLEEHPEDDHIFAPAQGREAFLKSVARIREYILAGDTMQVQLSERFSGEFNASPLDLYRALRRLNPSPYMFLLRFQELSVVGSSPEVLVRSEGRRCVVRPIAGTRRRGRTPDEDAALGRELAEDPKEIAEHLMLLDLARNDIGRIAEIGSVEVVKQMDIEHFSHVMHLTSEVVGTVRDGVNAFDLLRATFPAGTLTGAPKVRAMEIIAELEPHRRGIYGGGIGHIGYSGDINIAIGIRTGLIKDGQLHIQAAGGVVADSDPELEWKEAQNKARAMVRAAGIARRNAAAD